LKIIIHSFIHSFSQKARVKVERYTKEREREKERAIIKEPREKEKAKSPRYVAPHKAFASFLNQSHCLAQF
jgi:hypothetical protein